jgi:hypothetical protein
MRSRVPESRILRTTKTALKPRIKLMVIGTTRALGAGASGDSGTAAAPRGLITVPPRKQSQEGMRGSTQGDKKDSSPAAKASRIDKFSVILPNTPLGFVRFFRLLALQNCGI